MLAVVPQDARVVVDALVSFVVPHNSICCDMEGSRVAGIDPSHFLVVTRRGPYVLIGTRELLNVVLVGQ